MFSGHGDRLRAVEPFESFVLAMEHEGLVVSPAVKFDMTRQTRKTSHSETQTHGSQSVV